jgi:hypothetical protein
MSRGARVQIGDVFRARIFNMTISETEQRHELMKYHPNRYTGSRQFFRPLFNQFRQSADVDGVLPASAFTRICDKLTFEYWNPELDRFPVEQRPENPTHLIVSEQSMFMHVARFTLCGRNIFHFSRTLTTLLRLTDVDDVIWSSIKLPYSAFYLWFGPQEELRFGGGRYCADGAYVSGIPNGIQILVTTVEPEIDCMRPPSFALHRDFYYYISFQFTGDDTVGAAFARTLGTDAMFQRGFQPPEIQQKTQRLAQENGITLLQKSPDETAQAKTVEERIADLPVFRQVLRLLMNGLCYLSSPSREVNRKYRDSLADQAALPALTKREIQRLRRDGYTEINFCGESLDRQYGAAFNGKELSPHWRRGHWRNQAVGSLRAGHRLTWIRPTLVRKDKQRQDEVVGHLYRVE